jgi:hypothetical protein
MTQLLPGRGTQKGVTFLLQMEVRNNLTCHSEKRYIPPVLSLNGLASKIYHLDTFGALNDQWPSAT